MKRVLFICRDNACLSLIAHALGQRFAAEAFLSLSAGLSPAKEADPMAAALLSRVYRLDVGGWKPRGLEPLPPADLAVLLGEEVSGLSLPCPVIRLPLPHPDGQEEEAYGMVIEAIEKEIWRLRQEFLEGRYAK